MKKRIIFGIVGMMCSVLFAKKTAEAYLLTYEPILLVLFVLFIAGFLAALLSVLECTPLADLGERMFDERKGRKEGDEL